jgi:hypothetical protein
MLQHTGLRAGCGTTGADHPSCRRPCRRRPRQPPRPLVRRPGAGVWGASRGAEPPKKQDHARIPVLRRHLRRSQVEQRRLRERGWRLPAWSCPPPRGWRPSMSRASCAPGTGHEHRHRQLHLLRLTGRQPTSATATSWPDIVVTHGRGRVPPRPGGVVRRGRRRAGRRGRRRTRRPACGQPATASAAAVKAVSWPPQ